MYLSEQACEDYLGKHTAINFLAYHFFIENKNLRGSLVQIQPRPCDVKIKFSV